MKGLLVLALLAAAGCPHIQRSEPAIDAAPGGAGDGAPPGPELGTWVEDWRDEIVYQLLVDRFANGDPGNDLEVGPQGVPQDRRGYHGGDWQGVIDRLDYLEALGVTAIWISPVVRNTGGSYHGYATQAFDEPNPNFGDLAALRAMVDAAHARGIKVIVDVVINHAGPVFFYDRNGNGVEDPGELAPPFEAGGVTTLDGTAPAPIVFFDDPDRLRFAPTPPAFANPDWYNRHGQIVDWGDPEQRLLGDFRSLKDLDTRNPDVRAALIDVFADWIEATDIDGFRIDTAGHVEHAFLREFATAMRERAAARGKQRFFLFGEVFDGDPRRLATFTEDGGLDAVLDFQRYFEGFVEVFARGAPTTRLEAAWREREEHFTGGAHPGGIGVPPGRAQVTFLDNHDVHRFLHDTPSPAALRSALAYLLTTDGVPCVYYGTEQEFDGGRDPLNREPLWESDYDTGGETFAFLARLIEIRKQREALRRGETRFRWVSPRTGDEQDAGIVAFERFTATETVLVVINASDAGTGETSGSTLGFGDMPVGFPPGTLLTDLLDPAAPPVIVDPQQHALVRVPARGARILVPAP